MKYVSETIEMLKAHWLTVLALVGAVCSYATPAIANNVAKHPRAAFWFGLVSVVVAFYLRSPIAPIAKAKPSV
jgi:hypothetical protein